MQQNSSFTTAFAATISFFYVLFSALLIMPIYYKVPAYSVSVVNQYKALSADFPTITKFALALYDISYVFIVGVIIFAVLFFYKNLKSKVSMIIFIIMNFSLVLCWGWSEFVSYSLILPMAQLLRFSV